MIDDMVALLAREQTDDTAKKANCESQIDSAEDEAKVLAREVSNLDKAIAKNKDAIATLTEEIAELDAGIKDLDAQVAAATSRRQQEHANFQDDLSANKAAVEIIAFARNRMNLFYNPKLHKAAPKRELSEEERIVINQGGTLAPTAAPGGIAGTGVTALLQVAKKDAPAPPPETFDAYQSKGEESAGVLSMMDLLTADLEKEIQEMTVDEKNAQEEYEQFVRDSAARRAADSKLLEDKEGVKADTAAALTQNGQELKAKTAEAYDNDKYLHNVHLDCDWLIQNFDARKAARAAEVDSLKRAKAVLAGADYSLMQQTSRRYLRSVARVSA